MLLTMIGQKYSLSVILSVFVFYLLIFLGIWIVQTKKQKKYQATTYYQQTHTDYAQAMHKDIGKRGEFLVFEELNSLESDGARFLFNIYIPKQDGSTAEIDVVIVTKAAIFVIESKNYSGWIFGNENSKLWMQTLKDGSKHQFYNPIWQNKTHCKVLADVLKIPCDQVISCIVFSDRCTFKKIPDSTSSVRILHRKQLKPYIEMAQHTLPEIYNETDVEQMYNTLLPFTQTDLSIRQKHIAEINSYKAK